MAAECGKHPGEFASWCSQCAAEQQAQTNGDGGGDGGGGGWGTPSRGSSGCFRVLAPSGAVVVTLVAVVLRLARRGARW